MSILILNSTEKQTTAILIFAKTSWFASLITGTSLDKSALCLFKFYPVSIQSIASRAHLCSSSVHTLPREGLGVWHGSTGLPLHCLNLCDFSLSLSLSFSVSFLIWLLRDRQVMEKKLKGKIQGKCKWKEVIITVIMKCLSFKYKNVTLKWTCDPEMHF